jgi:SPP1 family predicted phage head-tail adaptor
MQAGQLNRLVTLRTKAITRTSTGAESWAWVVRGEVWAAILPIRGREYMAADSLRADVEVRIVTRADRNMAIDATWQALSEGVAYSIKSVIQSRTDRAQIELMCSAGVAQE